MRILFALIAAGLLFSVAGCHEKKDSSTTPGSTMGDAGAASTAPASPQYPPAQ